MASDLRELFLSNKNMLTNPDDPEDETYRTAFRIRELMPRLSHLEIFWGAHSRYTLEEFARDSEP